MQVKRKLCKWASRLIVSFASCYTNIQKCKSSYLGLKISPLVGYTGLWHWSKETSAGGTDIHVQIRRRMEKETDSILFLSVYPPLHLHFCFSCKWNREK